MKRVTIYFGNNKNIDCKLEEEVANEVIDAFSKGIHDKIALNLSDKQILIVCSKIEFIEIKDI